MSATTPSPQHLPTEIILKITHHAITDYLADFPLEESLHDLNIQKLTKSLHQILSIACVDIACKLQVNQLVKDRKTAMEEEKLKKLERVKETCAMICEAEAKSTDLPRFGSDLTRSVCNAHAARIKKHAVAVLTVLDKLRL